MLVDLVSLLGWMAIMIAITVTGRVPENHQEALAFATEQHWLYYRFSYANAVVYTLLNALVYAGLYAMLKNDGPGWAEMGIILLPVVAFLNLFSYLSQLVLIPRLLELAAMPDMASGASALLHQLIQMSPEGSLGYFDQFGYFMLSVPALVFGGLLYRRGKPFRVGGGLLALSGVATLPIGPGVMFDMPRLVATPSMLGGVMSIAAFGFIMVSLLRAEPDRRIGTAGN